MEIEVHKDIEKLVERYDTLSHYSVVSTLTNLEVVPQTVLWGIVDKRNETLMTMGESKTVLLFGDLDYARKMKEEIKETYSEMGEYIKIIPYWVFTNSELGMPNFQE